MVRRIKTSKLIDLTGKRFGRLTIIEFAFIKNYKKYWQCKCVCGNIKIIQEYSLKNGTTISCGCSKKEGHGFKHGYSGTRIYHVWENIIQRCTNFNFPDYPNYGGRNIEVCNHWLKFENFLNDMGLPPSAQHQIDRINNNLGYYKENCKWVTRKTNNRNKRSNHLIVFNNETKCLIEWAEKYSINPKTLWHRLVTLNWSVEEALTIPVRKRGGRI